MIEKTVFQEIDFILPSLAGNLLTTKTKFNNFRNNFIFNTYDMFH